MDQPSDADSITLNSICAVCKKGYTTSGDHRMAALGCGHLIGKSCIKSLRPGSNEVMCPTCKKASKREEVVSLFTQGIKAVDASKTQEEKRILSAHLVRLQGEIQELTMQESRLEHELTNMPPPLEESLVVKRLSARIRRLKDFLRDEKREEKDDGSNARGMS